MGKHVFTLSLRTEIEAEEIENGESGAMLNIAPETLHSIVTGLRTDALSEADEMAAEEFDGALNKAKEVNQILAQLDALDMESYDSESDED